MAVNQCGWTLESTDTPSDLQLIKPNITYFAADKAAASPMKASSAPVSSHLNGAI